MAGCPILWFYQAISAVTNSGFDVTGNSILPFAHDYFFFDLYHVFDFYRWDWVSSDYGFPRMGPLQAEKIADNCLFVFHCLPKIAVLAFVILFIGGTIAIYFLEKDHLFKDYGF